LAVAVDGPVQIGPAAPHLDVCLIDVPVPAVGATPAVPTPAKLVGQHRGELRLPLADGLVAEHQAADEEHLGQVA